jgi:hypothetical protein
MWNKFSIDYYDLKNHMFNMHLSRFLKIQINALVNVYSYKIGQCRWNPLNVFQELMVWANMCLCTCSFYLNYTHNMYEIFNIQEYVWPQYLLASLKTMLIICIFLYGIILQILYSTY